MSQNDFVIADSSGAAVRADINSALQALASLSSGATEPGTMYAYQWWADSTSGSLKLRNAANSAWITIGTLSTTNLGLLSLAGGTLTGAMLAAVGSVGAPSISFSGDTDTGFYWVSANVLAGVVAGTEIFRINSVGMVLGGTGAVTVPAGTTGQRPGSPAEGMIRKNSTTNYLEGYINGAWQWLVSLASLALGDILYASATDVLSKLAGNITTTEKYLSQTGSGSSSAAPTWKQVSLTAGVSGILPVANGGTGVSASHTIVQMQSVMSTGNDSTTTTIPADATIPQSSEGKEFMTLAITPKNASNLLEIEVTCVLEHSASNVALCAALFQDSGTDALAAGPSWSSTTVAGNPAPAVRFVWVMTAGTTSLTTFKVRGGAGTAGTTTFNSTRYGGVMASSIVIREYAA